MDTLCFMLFLYTIGFLFIQVAPFVCLVPWSAVSERIVFSLLAIVSDNNATLLTLGSVELF